jgi:NADH-quinone oxidoreductase subunit J
MITAFYIAATVAVISTFMVITRLNAVSALLYMILSLLSLAVIFYLLGAPFVAALEIIIYAGAIMVLFVFVVMMLNLGDASKEQEKKWLSQRSWIGPAILSAVMLGEIIYILLFSVREPTSGVVIGPKEVGMSLFGPYMIGVELAAMLLIAGIVGAYHLGKRKKITYHRFLEGHAK